MSFVCIIINYGVCFYCQLKWPLKMGKNDIVFSITTKYQGTAKATCSLYLWNSHDKLVISDFDGTVTKSDVAGQVLPLIGKDWTQDGIIELFSAIDNNGYRFVYLSSRAIGQSKYTKNYLRSTCRGDRHLPDGPLLVTPFSLYTAFRMEVIEKKPEEFKISCLKQVKGLFAERHNPFHAGFGNKHSVSCIVV
jgi:phosphatidate phosphatase LPIN